MCVRTYANEYVKFSECERAAIRAKAKQTVLFKFNFRQSFFTVMKHPTFLPGNYLIFAVSAPEPLLLLFAAFCVVLYSMKSKSEARLSLHDSEDSFLL